MNGKEGTKKRTKKFTKPCMCSIALRTTQDKVAHKLQVKDL